MRSPFSHLGITSDTSFLLTLTTCLFCIGLASCIPGLFGGRAERAREARVDHSMEALTERLEPDRGTGGQGSPPSLKMTSRPDGEQIIRQDDVRLKNGGTSMGAQLRMLRQDTEDRLAGVLTPKQLEEYRKLRDHGDARGTGPSAPRTGPASVKRPVCLHPFS